MAYLSLAVSVLVFVVCLKALNILAHVRRIVDDARGAHVVIRSRDLTDAEKEAATQRAAIAMVGSLASLVARVAVCVVLPVGGVWLGAQTGAYDTAEAMAAATDRVFIGLSSVVMIGLLVMMR